MVLDAAWGVLMSANFMHSRSFAELAWIAEKVESAMGLARLPRLEKHPAPAAPTATIPWYQRQVPWLTLPKLCLTLGLILLLVGLLALTLNFGVAVLLLIAGGLLTIAAILAMA